nr:probable inactive receptor kinase At1g48480 [Tanacetum cinerariifolium]
HFEYLDEEYQINMKPVKENIPILKVRLLPMRSDFVNSLDGLESDDGKLLGRAIVGIVIGVVFGLVLIIGVNFIMSRMLSKTRSLNQTVVQNKPSTTSSTPLNFGFTSLDHIMEGENTGSDEAYSCRVKNGDELVFLAIFLDDLLRASAEVLGKGVAVTTYKCSVIQNTLSRGRD